MMTQIKRAEINSKNALSSINLLDDLDKSPDAHDSHVKISPYIRQRKTICEDHNLQGGSGLMYAQKPRSPDAQMPRSPDAQTYINPGPPCIPN